MPERRNRADRILDAAADLLVRLGHRKVTIEDIARQADIGKGTVYLHWRTKDLLFNALFLREAIDLVNKLLDALRRDPTYVLPHRFAVESYRMALDRPLIRALTTNDIEMIGKIKRGPMAAQDMLAGDQYYALMFRHGLLRDDVPHMAYAVQATATGFHLVSSLRDIPDEPDDEGKAAALGHTIRHAFEPPGDPDPEAVAQAANEVHAVFENLIHGYRKWVYEHDPEQPG